MHRCLLILALLVSLPASAAADDADERWYPTLQLGAGASMNVGSVAGLSRFGGEIELEGELRVSDGVLLSVDYALGSGSATDVDRDLSLGMTAHRVSAKLRHPILGFGDEELHGDYHVLAGIGREQIRWNEGGRLGRTFGLVGFGCGLTFDRPGHGQAGRWMTGRFGLRAQVARGPDPGKRPFACDGPCDTETKVRPYDLTLVLGISGHWGR